jgi:hypothetical protein
MLRTTALCFFALAVSCLSISSAWAQKNARNQADERRENQRVADAERRLRQDQNELQSAQRELQSLLRASGPLNMKLAQARNHWRETRDMVADKLAENMGIEAALERLKKAKANLSTFSKPILDQLHATGDWQAAKRASDEAKAKADQVRESNELDDAARSKQLKELSQLALRPDELEKQAVLKLSEGKRLTDEVSAALAAIEKIRRAIPDEKIDADPTVAQTKKNIEKAEQDIVKHSQEVAAQRSQVQKAQAELISSGAKLQQAKSADARDKNRK